MKWWTYWALREGLAVLPALLVFWLVVAALALVLVLLAPWAWERLGTGYEESSALAFLGLCAAACALWLERLSHLRKLSVALWLLLLLLLLSLF